jgi:hypothetical protein
MTLVGDGNASTRARTGHGACRDAHDTEWQDRAGSPVLACGRAGKGVVPSLQRPGSSDLDAAAVTQVRGVGHRGASTHAQR